MAARECRICGGKPTTLEHLWPKWLRRFSPHPVGVYRYGITSDPTGWQKFQRASFDHKSRVLCRLCNERLGTELEGPVAVLFERLLTGDAVAIPPGEQRLLAQWFYKTGLMVATTVSAEAATLPSRHYRDLGTSYDLPPTSVVWVGQLEGRLQEAGLWVQRFQWQDRLLDDPPASEGYILVLGVLDLAAVIGVLDARQSPASTDMNPFLLGDLGAARLLRIWPPSSFYSQSWPPPLPLRGQDLSQIAERFVRLVNSGRNTTTDARAPS